MNILAIIPVTDKVFRKAGLEIASYASRLAEQEGGSFSALVIGDLADGEMERLGQHGALKILHMTKDWTGFLDNHQWSLAITGAARKTNPGLLVFPDNAYGKALAPAVAIQLDAGFISGVDGLPLSMDPLCFNRKTFSGKAFARVSTQADVNVITLSPNSFGLVEKAVSPVVEVFEPETVAASSTVMVERRMAEGKLLMSEADIIVSGGRGMKGPEHWNALEDLARSMGAATACSRPVSDEGWRPHDEHVGQTGKVVAPNLYIACGISGAVQHLAGISSSKVLVAINKDPDAPIFSAADYGIIGDVHQVLPKLTAAYMASLDQ